MFVRQLGILGVGQTSWGPTMFAVTRDHNQATWLQQEIAQRFATTKIDFEISPVDNRGAFVEGLAS